ncbi:MAG TPA: M20/M25/M40 family metallo-hydrolase [Pyrinomonadaceae bacterium]|nr:M20/M25/M40 family metallo-hydrolase [Pyrinomonadaceae bacterium]
MPTLAIGQTAVRVTPAEKKMAAAITADQLSNYLYFVASDAMGGRDTPSQGLDTTAEFLKMQLSRWGFKPAGDNGTFFQKIALRSESVDPANNLLQVDNQSYTLGDDYVRVAGNGSANALTVFGGNGWMVRAKGLDPYKGVDVKGKIVVLYGEGFPSRTTLTRMPAGISQTDLAGTKGADWADPVTYAMQQGAAGIILVASPQAQEAWGQIRRIYGRGSMYPEKFREGAVPLNIPVMLVSSKIGGALFQGASAGKDSATPFAMNKTVSMTTMSKAETKWTQNVVALWEGRDPVLKNEMVAIGAHYDHVGTNPNAPGDDKIYNGADDDGSGTVAVLSIAEALAKSKVRPKRSVLFVWHCGEEKGLWGSEYFNKFPTVDIKKVVTQLNIDMIGRSKKSGDANPKNKELSGENEIYVIGKDMMSSTLGSIVDKTNKGYLNLAYDTRYDDPKDPNRFFFRSDHFNYAQNGIPITFWFDGVHEDYHQPGDEPQKIDYQKMEKVARTIFLTMWEVSDLRSRPTIDKQLPPELTQR